ncbi:MAG: tRNA preQ1(34) S-adenosylmethionine ribosyltransferase-isomerase QueA [Elusimicrobia bacterium]|nr:tRNA preQ1(34) S-adenosylmethionine ribosyltransferase-isomerase QueA [Elusimicrobiota bacterium]
MPLADYDFEFPEELIASVPAEPRDSSRLMVVNRRSGAWEHKIFRNLPEFLGPGDCLVLNKTKVFACRLSGKKSTGGKAELLLVKELEPGLWAALASGFKKGGALTFAGGMNATVEGLNEDGEYLVRFSSTDVMGYLEQNGLAPLPPYILKKKGGSDENDLQRYQTVYAREKGSIAAPTAGLHFTHDLLDRLKDRGVGIAELTLHVGRGTFRPIDAEDAAEHEMLPEWYRLSEDQAELIKNAKRVVSVGTTSTRTLETLAAKNGGLETGEGWTELYIRPGHVFKAVGGLITNFHLPKSTPLLLASAFLGRETLLSAYREAFARRYRLYSYGDAMLIL